MLPQCEEIITQSFEDGTVVINTRKVEQTVITKKVFATYKAPLGLEIPLFQYAINQDIIHEAVQDCPWSDGPHVFLALQDSSNTWIPQTLWTVIEIRKEVYGE